MMATLIVKMLTVQSFSVTLKLIHKYFQKSVKWYFFEGLMFFNQLSNNFIRIFLNEWLIPDAPSPILELFGQPSLNDQNPKSRSINLQISG